MRFAGWAAGIVSAVLWSFVILSPVHAQSDRLIHMHKEFLRLRAGGDLKGAVRLAERIVVRAERELGTDHLVVAQALNNLALLKERAGKLDLAARHYGRALEIMKRNLGRKNPQVGIVLNNLAAVTLAKCDFHGARRLYLKSANILTLAYGRGHRDARMALENFQRISRAIGWADPDDAHKSPVPQASGWQLKVPQRSKDSLVLPAHCMS